MHENVVYKCSKCQSEYRSKSTLKNHMKVCDGKFRKLPKRNELMRNWRDKIESTIVCIHPNCMFSCLKEVTMKKHALKIHGNQDDCLVCTICNTIFESAEIWLKHIEQHEKSSSEALNKFKCKFCSSCFLDAEKLSTHEKNFHTESSERIYKCDECNSFFKTIGTLKTHISFRHSKTRQYECSICRAAFPMNWGLTSHMKIHNNERNYKCRLCDMASNSSGNLRKHMVKIHGTDKVYKCDDCDELFKLFVEFKNHKKNHHDVIEEEITVDV